MYAAREGSRRVQTAPRPSMPRRALVSYTALYHPYFLVNRQTKSDHLASSCQGLGGSEDPLLVRCSKEIWIEPDICTDGLLEAVQCTHRTMGRAWVMSFHEVHMALLVKLGFLRLSFKHEFNRRFLLDLLKYSA